eukprot:SAG31_NODE_12895_length_908_cov_0.841780_2_plen_131_part_01
MHFTYLNRGEIVNFYARADREQAERQDRIVEALLDAGFVPTAANLPLHLDLLQPAHSMDGDQGGEISNDRASFQQRLIFLERMVTTAAALCPLVCCLQRLRWACCTLGRSSADRRAHCGKRKRIAISNRKP